MKLNFFKKCVVAEKFGVTLAPSLVAIVMDNPEKFTKIIPGQQGDQDVIDFIQGRNLEVKKVKQE